MSAASVSNCLGDISVHSGAVLVVAIFGVPFGGGDFLDLLGLGLGDPHGLGVLVGVLGGGHPRVRVPVLVQFLAGVLPGDRLAPGPEAVLADPGRLAGLAEQVAPADGVGGEVVGVLVKLPLGADAGAAVTLPLGLDGGPLAAGHLGDQGDDFVAVLGGPEQRF